jgi:hypothetical protein
VIYGKAKRTARSSSPSEQTNPELAPWKGLDTYNTKVASLLLWKADALARMGLVNILISSG